MQRPFAPLLAFAIGLLLVCNLAVVVVHVLDDHTTLISGGARPSKTVESTEVLIVPREGQAFVTGTIETLSADDAQVQPLATPFTITAVERGVGRLVIDKALVGGRRVTITWEGGTPLPVSGDGALEIGTTHVEASGNGLTYSLDGASRTFQPGTYSLGASVGVGTGGLASPRDGVQFTADKDTVLTSRGNVVVRMGLQKVDLLGPGKIAATGDLKVQFPDRTDDATSVLFGAGPYRVTLDPGSKGIVLDAILQGAVQVT